MSSLSLFCYSDHMCCRSPFHRSWSDRREHLTIEAERWDGDRVARLARNAERLERGLGPVRGYMIHVTRRELGEFLDRT